MTVRFLLLMPWGRVGSNLVFDILRQSARMKLANESLNALKTWPEQQAWFAQFYETARPATEHGFIGSKQNMLAVRDDRTFASLCREAGVRIVRLRRASILKAAVSQMRAEQHARTTGSWAVKRGGAVPGPSAIEPELLLKRLKMMEDCDRRLTALFAAEETLDIAYEELNAALDTAIARVRAYLGVPQTPYKVPFDKATPDRLEEAIVNLDAVRAALKGTRYEGEI
ncbi:MAG: hypothetical protein JO261_10330 [Alphaproteobacteria bacterium]|nr:hypothetical protein [Alphaproteobacteria bacterium]MBV9694084.1 hypothetical protein [Alphaproteobacteria bacterium]